MKKSMKPKYVRRRTIAELLIGQALLLIYIGMFVYGILGG